MGKKIMLLYMILLAVARVLERRPRLNRFTSNGRVYQRDGTWLSFSAKTTKTDDGHLVALKRRIDPAWDLAAVVDHANGIIGDARGGKKSQSDKELALALALPSFLTKLAVRALRYLDECGLLPRALIDGDPLFTSAFIANLGSIGMDAPFHHLYEYGNIPLFIAVGAERTELALVDGAVVARPVIPFRFSFDERVEDGLYCLTALQMLQAMLEDPVTAFAPSEAPIRSPHDVVIRIVP